MAVGMSLTVKDKGFDGLFARVKGINTTVAGEVGVIEPEDPETTYIARVHELGLGNNPQRSFLRKTMDLYRDRYRKLATQAYGNFLDGKWTITQAMKAVNVEIVADIQKRLLRGIPPKLESATVRSKERRGLPRPKTALYATGKLFNAIKERVVGGGKGGV